MKEYLTEALEDEYCCKKLIVLAVRHGRLVLEFGNRGTSNERKAEIKREVTVIRVERDQLLDTASFKK
ncbi:hypothetical protein ACQKLN_17150 [Paenibacillus glucanolyticus]|uniref:hypothetical protein n=1 Tax=Paenibacillus glucanolyticus TaxID=59843 RepID=UPI00367E455E